MITFFILIAIVGLIVASIYDLKTMEIPNRIFAIMTVIGLIGHAYYSFKGHTWWAFGSCLLGIGIFAAFGLGAYYLHAWNAGDAKIMIGIGALLPVMPLNMFIQMCITVACVIIASSLVYGAYFRYYKKKLEVALLPAITAGFIVGALII